MYLKKNFIVSIVEVYIGPRLSPFVVRCLIYFGGWSLALSPYP